MSLNDQDIQRIANLARLELQPDEQARMLSKINGFFDIVEQMQAVPTDGVVPMSHPVDAMQNLVATVADTDDHGMTLRLREDKVSETNEREANMQNAPAKDRGLFLVPKVIE